MMSNHNTGGMQRDLSRFAGIVSGIGSIFLAPYVAQHYRYPMYEYLYTGFDTTIAYYGSWGFVALVIAGAYFGGSMLLQILIHLLFRAGTMRGSL